MWMKLSEKQKKDRPSIDVEDTKLRLLIADLESKWDPSIRWIGASEVDDIKSGLGKGEHVSVRSSWLVLHFDISFEFEKFLIQA